MYKLNHLYYNYCEDDESFYVILEYALKDHQLYTLIKKKKVHTEKVYINT